MDGKSVEVYEEQQHAVAVCITTIPETNSRRFVTARHNARSTDNGSNANSNIVSNDLDISRSNTPYTHAQTITS
jgi:hypothetical protein